MFCFIGWFLNAGCGGYFFHWNLLSKFCLETRQAGHSPRIRWRIHPICGANFASLENWRILWDYDSYPLGWAVFHVTNPWEQFGIDWHTLVPSSRRCWSIRSFSAPSRCRRCRKCRRCRRCRRCRSIRTPGAHGFDDALSSSNSMDSMARFSKAVTSIDLIGYLIRNIL